MKEKILQLLRAKFPGTPTIVIDRVADHLSQTVTEESQLETAIAGVEPLVTSFATILQSETDRRVTDAQKKALEAFRAKHGLDENGKPIQNPNPNPTPGGGDDKLAKELEEMRKRLDGYEAKEKAGMLHNSLKSKLAEKKIPDTFIKGRTVESEEQIDAVLAEIEADYTSVKQHLINEGVVGDAPRNPIGNPSNVDADIASWAKS